MREGLLDAGGDGHPGEPRAHGAAAGQPGGPPAVRPAGGAGASPRAGDDRGDAPCQEVVIRPPFDLRRLIPAPTNTLLDAGPYFNMGLLRAEDPETGESDVTIPRLCI